jgi:hypothetical protein
MAAHPTEIATASSAERIALKARHASAEISLAIGPRKFRLNGKLRLDDPDGEMLLLVQVYLIWYAYFCG